MTRLDGDEVAIRIVLDGFRGEAVALRETRFERPVSIDDSGVEIVAMERPTMPGVELLDDEVFGLAVMSARSPGFRPRA